MTFKLDKKLKEFDYREQIFQIMNKAKEDKDLAGQVVFCLEQIDQLKKQNYQTEVKNKFVDQTLQRIHGDLTKKFSELHQGNSPADCF